jgi:hypothetical protein
MNKSRRMRWVGRVARFGVKRNACRLFVGKPEGKKPQRRPRLMRMVNIKMELGEVGSGVVDGIGLAQDMDKWRPLVNAVINFRVA